MIIIGQEPWKNPVNSNLVAATISIILLYFPYLVPLVNPELVISL